MTRDGLMRKAICAVAMAVSLGGAAGAAPASAQAARGESTAPFRWNSSLLNRDASWYATPEARQIADAVRQWQSVEGGWPKNLDLAYAPQLPEDLPHFFGGKANTIDNGATTAPIAYLARMVTATSDARYRASFERGIDYLLKAQYPNGGWPQYYPLRDGYYSRITFNDDAMVDTMSLLRDVAGGKGDYAFVDADRRAKAAAAVDRGLDVILKTQLKVGGKLAGWCAQYDEKTLEPAWARKYEPPSLSGGETVGVVRYLMQIERPSPQVVAAIEGAVAWLRSAAIKGYRLETFQDAAGNDDRRIVRDAKAPLLWARFYELETSRPIFLGRDSVFKYSLAEIEQERRGGYGYYGTWGGKLLSEDYPAWKLKHGR